MTDCYIIEIKLTGDNIDIIGKYLKQNVKTIIQYYVCNYETSTDLYKFEGADRE